MKAFSSSRIGGETSAATLKSAAPHVQCDLCSTPFVLPPEIAAQGVIHGLLVCSICIEDQLQSRTEIHQ